jgi:hypothetical protein
MRRTYRKIDGEWVEVTRQSRPVAPTIISDLDKPYITDDGKHLTSRSQVREHMRQTGQVPIQEHRDVMQDHVQHRQDFWRGEKRRRKQTIINVVKNYG